MIKLRKEIREKRKKKIKRIFLTSCISSYLVFGDYMGEGVVEIKKKNKRQYCCVLRISGIDIFHYTDDDKESVFKNFAAATMAMRLPYKYVFTDAHPKLKSQIEYLQYKMMKTNHAFSKAVLKNQIAMLEKTQETQRDKLAFLLIFSNNIEELHENAIRYIDNMQDTTVEYCDRQQIEEFFSNYMCCKDATKDNSYFLPEKIDFAQNHLQTESNYQTTIIIYDYPAILKNLEFASLIARLANVSFVLDVDTKPKSEVLKELKGSLKELRSRGVLNLDDTDREDTALEYQKLLAIRDSIANGNEQMFYTTMRIVVSDESYTELKKHVDSIILTLEEEGIACFVPINDIQEEYFGRLEPANTIKNPFPLHDTYKMQYPFYYQSHLDPTGMIFGKTITGGLCNIDFFLRNNMRPSYDIMLAGFKGSGKSVTLKSLVQDYLVLGNKIMVLDIESEYKDLAKMFDGQIIKLNKNSLLNPLELHKVIDSSREDSEEVDEESINTINFTTEISRIISFFYQYMPTINEEVIQVLKNVIVKTFAKKNIYDYTDVTTLKPSDFPIFSDVLQVIREMQAENGVAPRMSDCLITLELYVQSLAEGMYKSMFNGYSNVNISESNLIVFDVKSLSEMDNNIYNAQLFNILSLMWSEVCKNVDYNNNIKHPFDRRYVVSLIDEAHRFINSNNLQVTEFIEKLCRRTRKYDSALWLASQSITDYNPSGTGEGAEKVRIVFSLIQYKLILKQNPESYEALASTFKHFPKSELRATKDFNPGEMLISFGSDRNRIRCSRDINKISLFYIGNSRDKEEVVHKLFDMYYHELTHDQYAELLTDKKQKEKFNKVFAEEILNHYGYVKSDSEYLYKLVFASVGILIAELIYNLESKKAVKQGG